MPRIVSSSTLAEAGAGAAQPAYYLRIDWATTSSLLCSHSSQSWNGSTWTGAAFSVTFDGGGRPSSITLVDPDAAYRTLVLGGGISDRRVRLWKGYVGAAAIDDPVALFDGFADGADIRDGKVTISCDYPTTAAAFTPRLRIGPQCGINFFAPAGTTIRWGATILTLEPRRG